MNMFDQIKMQEIYTAQAAGEKVAEDPAPKKRKPKSKPAKAAKAEG